MLSDHGFHSLPVKRIVDETADTRTLVFEIPGDLTDLFRYEPGQFCTVRVNIGDDDVLRCYSMSSTPGIDDDLAVTIKRVPGGLLSNWLLDNVTAGDALELNRPSGVFVLHGGSPEVDQRPVVAFCGGSGVTPVFSIVKHVLATTTRQVKLLTANRDDASVIFRAKLDALKAAHPQRFELHHHIDADTGYLDKAAVLDFVANAVGAEFFICGPTPFMDLVERSLIESGVEPERIAIERFLARGVTAGGVDTDAPTVNTETVTETLTLRLKGRKHVLDYIAGDTVLDAARRGGLKPPYSCELGNCASCMALVLEGSATMKANNALSASEVDEGWVLTCQAIPQGRSVSIEYEDL